MYIVGTIESTAAVLNKDIGLARGTIPIHFVMIVSKIFHRAVSVNQLWALGPPALVM